MPRHDSLPLPATREAVARLFVRHLHLGSNDRVPREFETGCEVRRADLTCAAIVAWAADALAACQDELRGLRAFADTAEDSARECALRAERLAAQAGRVLAEAAELRAAADSLHAEAGR